MSTSRLEAPPFCQRFSAATALAAGQGDVVPNGLDVSNASSRAANHRQPRVSKAVVLVSEYHYQVTVPLREGSLPRVDAKNCLTSGLGHIPAGSRVLRVNFDGGDVFPKRPRPGCNVDAQLSQLGAGRVLSITCGVYRTPLQFSSCALRLGHPFDMCRALPDQALRTLAQILIDGPVVVLRKRLDVMVKWKAWAAELEEAEAELHRSLHPATADVLKGKRLLLLDRIAKSLEWPNTNLHRDLTEGFRIVGEEHPSGIFPTEPKPASLHPSGIFPTEPKPASLSVDELVDQSRLTKSVIWGQIRDAAKSWLEPARRWDELETHFGDWLPVRRFGVQQKDKLRPIDDLAENGTNMVCGGDFRCQCVLSRLA